MNADYERAAARAHDECPDCRHNVMRQAYACPSCGRMLRNLPLSAVAQCCAGFIALIIGLMMIGACLWPGLFDL
jgi:hypothetical protein